MPKPNETKTAIQIVQDIKTSMDNMKDNMVPVDQFKAMRDAVDALQVQVKQGAMNIHHQVKSRYFEGQKAARLVKMQILAARPNETKSFDVLAEEIYGKKDPQFVEEIKALAAGGNAGTLIEEDYFAEVIPLLYPKLSAIRLGARKIPMPNGNINIRKMISGSTAQWIGESQSILGSQPRFGNLRLSSKKLSVKVPYSNDLLRSDSVSADQIVLDDMVSQLLVAMDLTCYYGRGTEYEPLGIKNIRGITTVTSTENLNGDAMYGQFVQPLKENDIPMVSLGWAFPPRVFTLLYNEVFPSGRYKYRDELLMGKLHGYPFVETNQITVNDDARLTADVFFGDFAQFFIGEQLALEIRTSDVATYADEEGNLVNAFDQDETVVKGLMICDMGAVYGKAFAYGQLPTQTA